MIAPHLAMGLLFDRAIAHAAPSLAAPIDHAVRQADGFIFRAGRHRVRVAMRYEGGSHDGPLRPAGGDSDSVVLGRPEPLPDEAGAWAQLIAAIGPRGAKAGTEAVAEELGRAVRAASMSMNDLIDEVERRGDEVYVWAGDMCVRFRPRDARKQADRVHRLRPAARPMARLLAAIDRSRRPTP